MRLKGFPAIHRMFQCRLLYKGAAFYSWKIAVALDLPIELRNGVSSLEIIEMKFARSSRSETLTPLPVVEAERAAALGPPVAKLLVAIIWSP
jgi:hypothetical protein